MADLGEENKVSGVARVMVLLAWLAAIAFMTWLGHGVLMRDQNPNQQLQWRVSSEGVPEVVLQRNRDGHYVANGRINGEAVVFLLDTGATDVALSEALAQRLGLRSLGTVYGQTANGVVQGWRARLDEVQLGAITLRNVRASVLPAMLGGDEVLLGMSFLKHLEWVQQADQLTLRQVPR